jgi:protein SCO1/2
MSRKQSTEYRLLGLGIGILVGFIALVAGYIVITLVSLRAAPGSTAELIPASSYDGVTRIDPAVALPAFSLLDQTGTTFQSDQLIGKPTLFAFGFTHCPDICPLTLGEIRAIHEGLAEDANALQFVFISVDGTRDTPEVIRTYLQTLRVDSFMIGLSGAEDQLHIISETYGAQFIYGQADANGSYSVDHTAGMFLLDEEGRWIRRYAFGTLRSLIVNDIRAYLQQ